MTYQTPKTWPDLFKTGEEVGSADGGAPCGVEGTIPPELDGDLVAMGPLHFEVQGTPVNSWFDGQGGIHRIRLHPGDNSAEVWTRVAESDTWLEEEELGAIAIHHFALPKPNTAPLKGAATANVSNTQLLFWRNHWMALYEGGVPVEVKAECLSRCETPDVVIENFADGEHLSAHFHSHPSGDIYNYGLVHREGDLNLHRTDIKLYRFPAGESQGSDPDTAEYVGEFNHRDYPFLHDFILTQNYAVFVIPPVGLDVGSQLLNNGTLAENFHWLPENKTRIVVMTLADGRIMADYKVEACWIWHFVNAFETPHAKDSNRTVLTIDSIDYEDYDRDIKPFILEIHTGEYPSSVKGSKVVRRLFDFDHTVDGTQTEFATFNYSETDIVDVSCEFGRVNPDYECRSYNIAYIAAHSSVAASTSTLWDTLGKVSISGRSVRRYTLGSEQIPSEPIFVPRENPVSEDDGYVLCIVYDGLVGTSWLAVIDARYLKTTKDVEGVPYELHADAVMARIRLPHRVPVTFHRIWIPEACQDRSAH